MPDRALGWHPPSQERRAASVPYRLSEMAPDFDLEQPVLYRMRRKYVWLDQGQTSACTGFGAAAVLSMSPYRKSPITNAIGQQIYAGAKRWDEWAGENYDGSSALGAMSFLLHRSTYLREYWHCLKPTELAHAVSLRTAVEVGTDWLSGMWEPDSNGYVHATGTNEGGHAYAIAGVDPVRHRYRIDNSWGSGWGRGGSAYIAMDELHDLVFNRNGEAIMPRKRLTGGALL